MQEEAIYYHCFNLFPQIGPSRFKKLLTYFGSIKKAWEGDESELERAGLEKEIVKEIIEKRKVLILEQEQEKLDKENIALITWQDENYPKLLKEIYDPPPVLYCCGDFLKQDEFSLAVVGSRRISSYGSQAAPFLISDLVKGGMTIVSGLARGIDTLAHKTTLQFHGRTIAVLGSSIDRQNIYPPENKDLAFEIVKSGGMIISEYPPPTPALPFHFPTRNRIIAGLCLGTLVIEASDKSGALLTAKHSLEQNREVFAVPGPIFSQTSKGANHLIKMGAKLVQEPKDIIEELNLNLAIEYTKVKEIIPDNPQEELILKILSFEPRHIDKIIKMTKLDTSTVGAALTLMEIKGKVKNLGGLNYVLAR